MSERKNEFNPDFLEYCEIINLKPTERDHTIFMAGMTFESLKQRPNILITSTEGEK